MATLNPSHLRTFLAVKKHLSFTRAAEDVYLSQPAVSRQIQQLERDLGVSLFEQIGKSLHVTDAGTTLAQEAERLLASLDRVTESVTEHRSAEKGRLRIGAGTTPGFYITENHYPPHLHLSPKGARQKKIDSVFWEPKNSL